MGQHKNNPVALAVAAGKAVCSDCRKVILEISTALPGAVYTCPACAEESRIRMAQDRRRRPNPSTTALLAMAAAISGGRRGR